MYKICSLPWGWMGSSAHDKDSVLKLGSQVLLLTYLFLNWPERKIEGKLFSAQFVLSPPYLFIFFFFFLYKFGKEVK